MITRLNDQTSDLSNVGAFGRRSFLDNGSRVKHFSGGRSYMYSYSRPERLRAPLFLAFLSTLVVCLLFVMPAAATQTDIAGPAGSGQFGASVTVLPNGNFVVIDTL